VAVARAGSVDRAAVAAAIMMSIWRFSLIVRHSPMARNTSTAMTATPAAASTAPNTPPTPSGVAHLPVQPTFTAL
jgi:hypothetical protein